MLYEHKHECAHTIECVHNNVVETLIEMPIPACRAQELMDKGCKVYVKTLRASRKYFFVLVNVEDLSKVTR
jgi:hypothetical protein